VDLESLHGLTKDTAIDGLYNIMRRDAKNVFQVAKEGLDDRIWLLLNEDPEHEGIRNIVQAWLGQTSLTEAGEWIARCQQVLTKTTAKPEDTSSLPSTKASAAPDLQDEEVAGFAVSDGKDQNSATAPEAAQELLRWQVRAFVLRCLSDLITAVGKDMELDPDSKAGYAVQHKVADVIRMAFLASTSSVIDLCVLGLRLIDQVLTVITLDYALDLII
jgi:HEAT repeat-containing protein 5